MNKEELKVRTGAQMERENYLLCFKSKAQITNILIDTEEENEHLKHLLNDVCFGDDVELACRYLTKLGFIEFDKDEFVYKNIHNNEPFIHDMKKEKEYYLLDEELNEYTLSLEKEKTDLQQRIDKAIEYIKHNITKISKEEYELWLICEEVDHLLEILKGE